MAHGGCRPEEARGLLKALFAKASEVPARAVPDTRASAPLCPRSTASAVSGTGEAFGRGAGGHREDLGSAKWRRRFLVLILAIGLVRGLLYLAIFPPWQHYDEPTHFEYVRLIAERGRLPREGDLDLGMRRQIAASMLANGFWKGMQAPALDLSSETPPSIGVSELYHPPLYYALLALPQRLVAHQGVETQLYVARFGSVLLSLLVLVSAYGVVSEAFPQRRWLPLAVAAAIALLPAFTDLMSAVNNDAGAAAAASATLWACVRLARRGPTLGRALVTLCLAGLCLLTKNTAGIVAVAAVLALGLSYVPRAWRQWVASGLALFLLVGAAAGVSLRGHAAHWMSENPPSAPNRVAAQSPLGSSTLILSQDGRFPRTVLQELPRAEGLRLRGRTVTFGAWVRAPEGRGGFVVLTLNTRQTEGWLRVQATPDWKFHAMTVTVRTDAPGVSLAALLPQREGAAQEVLLDGLVLVEGDLATRGQAPQFESAQATSAQWGDRRVTNLLRNGSAEESRPGLRGWIGNRTLFREPIARVFASLWDGPRTGWVYLPELLVLFRSFWGGFGWNHLALPTPYFYPLGIVTALACAGCGLATIRRWRAGRAVEPWQGRAWGVLAAAWLAGWGQTLLRIHPVLLTGHLSWPVARYAVSAIVPTVILLCLGLAASVPRRWRRAAAWAGLLCLLALDAVAMWAVILPYYYG